MLAKLLKYEFKDLGRILLPIYIAIIAVATAFAAILRASMSGTSVGFPLIYLLKGHRLEAASNTLMTIYILISVVLIAATLLLVIQRFTRNIFGNEGYLTMSLPINSSSQVAGKTISAAVWTLFSALVIMLSVLIILMFVYGPHEVGEVAKTVLSSVSAEIGTGDTAAVIIEFIIMMMIDAAAFVAKIFTSITIGHRLSLKHSRIVGVAVFVLITAVQTLIFSSINIKEETFYNFVLNISYRWGDAVIHTGFLIAIAVLLIETLIFSVITWKIMDKHLDLR